MKLSTKILIALLLIVSQSYAKKVEIENAKKVAASLFTEQFSEKASSDFRLSYTFNMTIHNGQTLPAIYVLTTAEGGTVFIAADDCSIPVLGYSERGEFNPSDMPINFRKWMEGYRQQIAYIAENNLPSTEEIDDLWQQYLTGQVRKPASDKAVSPLLTTTWDQSDPYNRLCPYNVLYNCRCLVGCVATAMAQVMRYWRFPIEGQGVHSYNTFWYGTQTANFGGTYYDWSHMPNQLTSSSSSTQINAVATLMYHCGVAVEMDYGQSGSGALVIENGSGSACAETALKSYFRYKRSLHGEKKESYTNTQWTNLLKSDLNNSRPIIYSGSGNIGGHCFVCDGYNSNDYFHFNWGWRGDYDGYFSLASLNPGTSNFTSEQQAIIGVEPDYDNTNPELKLYSNISMSATHIWFTSDFSVNVDIVNYYNSSFTGYVGAAIFDNNNKFIEFIDYQYTTIGANKYKSFTFSSAGSNIIIPGNYHVAIFQATTSGNTWVCVEGGDYTNWKAFDVYYTQDIETNSAFTITTDNGRLIQGKSATVNVDILNNGSSTFYGKVRVSLDKLDGSWAQNIGWFEITDGLKPNYHYTGGANFWNDVTVEPGTYLMSLAYQNAGSTSWYYAGARNYQNPIYVNVEAAPYSADPYEPNNSTNQAYNLNLSFSGNTATKNTTGSNFHNSSDVDYFKVVLPAGYNYIISPRIHDSYNSGNGINYTADALFSYSTNNGSTWSETYDDVMSGNISLENGGTVYFRVTPYLEGLTGTYLFSLDVTRSQQSTTHTITAKAFSHGSISPSGNITVYDGATTTFRITPDNGYEISKVLVNGNDVGAVSTYTFSNIHDNNVIMAYFKTNELTTHTITAKAFSHGSISPSGNITVYDGATTTFRITPDSGYEISKILVDGNDVGAGSTYIFSNIHDDHVIMVYFKISNAVDDCIQQFLKIYPNPANDCVYVEGENIEKVILINTNSQNIVIEANSQQPIMINTSNLASGLYLVKIIQQNGVITTDKLIINN